MKTEWDYTSLADAYLKRPDYSQDAINELFEMTGVQANDPVCDVGAGVAHLTLMLAKKNLRVHAVEPNDAMRANGIKRTEGLSNVEWFEGTGEQTTRSDDAYKLVTFGSSFNVTDRQVALRETKRILQNHGWFACMWNHRDLEDPIQKEIENIIKSKVEGYGYGTRREDQTAVIDESGLFERVYKIEGQVRHQQSKQDVLEAWRSHATLERQAGAAFSQICDAIGAYLETLPGGEISIPYTTRIWAARLK